MQREREDVGGGEGRGGHGWLLGNNNALLTDWKVSRSLSLSESWQDTACRCSATAFWIACCPGDCSSWIAGENGGWWRCKERREGGDGGRAGWGGVWLMDEIWVAFSWVYSMDEAAASSIHICLQATIHSSGMCKMEKGIGSTVCNLSVFLFAFYRAEEDMVSVVTYILLWHYMNVVSRLLMCLDVMRVEYRPPCL